MKIGVLIATYNGEKYIKEQLDSILNQTIPVDEIIISDDGSTDSTLEIILEYVNKYDRIDIKLVNNIGQHGVACNFENAFSNSTADFLFFCDQDDVWMDNKVEVFLEAEKEYPKCSLYFSNAELVDKDLNLLKKTVWDSFYWEGLDKSQYQVLEGEVIERILIYGNVVTGMCAAARREMIANIFPALPNMLHDDMIAAYCAINDSILAINKVTAYYRQHDNNAIGAFSKKKSFFQRIKYSEQRMNGFSFSFFRRYALYIFDKKTRYPFLRSAMFFYIKLRKYIVYNWLLGSLCLFRLLINGEYKKNIGKNSFKSFLFDLSIILLVSKKKRKDYFAKELLLPSKIEGVETLRNDNT